MTKTFFLYNYSFVVDMDTFNFIVEYMILTRHAQSIFPNIIPKSEFK